MILDETFDWLAASGAVTGRRLCAVHLGAYFTVVALEDGGVGACMSYYRANSPTASVLRQLADNVQANNIFNWDALQWNGFLGGGDITVHDIFSSIFYRNYINNFTGGGGAFDYYGTAFITSAGNTFPTPHVTLQPCAAAA